MLTEKLDTTPDVVINLFHYLFYRQTQKQFLLSMDHDEGTRIKTLALKDGYILKNCKLWAYANWAATRAGTRAPKPEDYGVERDDAKILRKLNLRHLCTKKFKPHTLNDMDHFVSMLCGPKGDLNEFVGKFISKKMTFLIKSFGQKREDLESELYRWGTFGLYKQYPRYENFLHFTNVAKTSIRNAGQTLIKHHTTQSRQQLARTADGGFEHVHVNLDVLADVSAPQGNEEVKEFIQSLAQLSPRMKPRPRRVVMALCGHHDPDFSAHLGESNSDAAQRMSFDKYKERVQQFYAVSDKDMVRIFTFLRSNM